MTPNELRLSLDYARGLLSYDPDSGLIVWRVSRGNQNARKGTIAGSPGRNGCLNITIDQQRFKAHRLAWFLTHGRWPDGVIDHVNGVSMDNRLENLRDVSQKVNSENQRTASINNRNGLLGVSPNPSKGPRPFRATITVDGKQVHLGCFATADAAHFAYLEAKRRLHAGCTI